MVPSPIAMGLNLCERVIFEQGTKNPSLINIFLGLPVARFPSDPVRFSAFAALTDSLGDGIIELLALQADTEEQIYSKVGRVHFPDRLTIVYTHFRVSQIKFPTPGLYVFGLLVDGEPVAERRLKVYQAEDQP